MDLKHHKTPILDLQSIISKITSLAKGFLYTITHHFSTIIEFVNNKDTYLQFVYKLFIIIYTYKQNTYCIRFNTQLIVLQDFKFFIALFKEMTLNRNIYLV